jgi:hypothetical protein
MLIWETPELLYLKSTPNRIVASYKKVLEIIMKLTKNPICLKDEVIFFTYGEERGDAYYERKKGPYG